MLLRFAHRIVLLALVGCAMIVAQSRTSSDSQNVFHGVALSFVSQRYIPKEKVPYLGDDFIDFSDLLTRFRLANNGSEDIFYLSDDVSTRHDPVGFQLFRPNKNSQWDAAFTPARGREGIFTGVAYKWLLLRPGSAIELETRDVSDKPGEHAASVFLNTTPTHEKRVELISNAFSPVSCPKR